MDREFNRDFLMALERWKIRYWYGRYDLKNMALWWNKVYTRYLEYRALTGMQVRFLSML